jgi:hypothetical protein
MSPTIPARSPSRRRSALSAAHGAVRPPADPILARIRGEYRDMPGLQLTPLEAARLLGVDPADCSLFLDQLTDAGFLRRRERGRYVLASGR